MDNQLYRIYKKIRTFLNKKILIEKYKFARRFEVLRQQASQQILSVMSLCPLS